jgi:hypothetical protein
MAYKTGRPITTCVLVPATEDGTRRIGDSKPRSLRNDRAPAAEKTSWGSRKRQDVNDLVDTLAEDGTLKKERVKPKGARNWRDGYTVDMTAKERIEWALNNL